MSSCDEEPALLTVCFAVLPWAAPEMVVKRLLERYQELNEVGIAIRDMKLELAKPDLRPTPQPVPYKSPYNC